MLGAINKLLGLMKINDLSTSIGGRKIWRVFYWSQKVNGEWTFMTHKDFYSEAKAMDFILTRKEGQFVDFEELS